MGKNQTMTDEQLARELQNGKRGGGRGKLLTVIGCAATAIGIFTSVTALTVIGIVVALLGQGVLNKHQKASGKAVFESLVPEIMNANFEDVQLIGKRNLVNIKGSNIPLPSYVYDSAKGRIDFTYRGLPSELCTVTLTDVDEYRNENNDMLESAERVVYTGQWMACKLDKTYPAELTFWPRGKLDKLFRAKTIKTDYEDFNKHFNLSCDDADWALRFLNPSRMERILALTNSAFGDFSVSLHSDGTLYLAVHSGRGFFDVGKGKEPPDALRRRFSFFEMEPGFDSEGFVAYQKSLDNEVLDELVARVKELNAEIARDRSLGRGFCIGHSYFCGRDVADEEWLREVVDYDILPMLTEYWFDDEAKLHRWENSLHGVFQR